ncbi:MAG: bifunctional phosphopantothenoylcysteine decarboxylase/phosphopantothenate--cysteine ligase CoaBC [Candidatus Polarisedimenticolia bacterium]
MRQLVLGVCGGIAAYKAADLVRAFLRRGADVTVALTDNAQRFVTPLTLQTLSGRRVITSTWDPLPVEETGGDAGDGLLDIEHIGLARRCEALVIAPATANVLGKLAAGIADDFLTTFALAVTCPVFVAPAMNTRMWEHPAVQASIVTLTGRGVRLIPPESGPLASRSEEAGMGRLADPETIASLVMEADAPAGTRRPLHEVAVLVTAGPTREELDPVRFLSNPSTGRMGFALAEAARDLGARVVLVSGPSHLTDPAGVQTVRVTTAAQMRDAVVSRLDGCAVLLMAAAVSDFRPAAREDRKVRKSDAPLELRLERTADILAEVAAAKGRRLVVGFAAETNDVLDGARRKLKEKRLDLIVANQVGGGQGFASLRNEATLLFADGTQEALPPMSKADLARVILQHVAGRLEASR